MKDKNFVEDVFRAVWFGHQAIKDSYLPPNCFLSVLFEFLETHGRHPDSFESLLQSKGLLSPFQTEVIQKRVFAGFEKELPAKSFSETPSLTAESQRYSVIDLLQQGGAGCVYRAYDKVIGRDVALKCPLTKTDQEGTELLRNEYRISGRLEHPNIVSIHDVGQSDELGEFFIMRLVEGMTLREALHDSGKRKLYGQTALIRIFLDICSGVAHAHSHKIIHRDLKPSNIMIGEWGDVQIMDWGIAQILDSNRSSTNGSSIVGTPGYIAPEQIENPESADERADIFSLGCILYELLTGEVPFWGSRLQDYVSSLAQFSPKPPSDHDKTISSELDDIVLSLLQKDRKERTQTVGDVYASLSVFLEGTRAKEMKRHLALSKVVEGKQINSQLKIYESDITRLQSELEQSWKKIAPYETVERKRELWSKEGKVKGLERSIMVHLGEATSAFMQALALSPKSSEAKKELAALYFERLSLAEKRGEEKFVAYYETMLSRYDDGSFEHFLKKVSFLSLSSNPVGAECSLFRLTECDKILVPTEEIKCKTTPIVDLKIEAGRYIAVLKKDGFVDTKVPLFLQRGQKSSYQAKLFKAPDLVESFCYIPGGHYLKGGDPELSDSGTLEVISLPDFFLAKYPITIKEYIDFLNDPEIENDEEFRVPRRTPEGGFYLEKNEQGHWFLPEKDAEGDHWELDWPVFSISWHDADCFVRWYAKKMGLPVRLPSVDEMEKAARGVDGRYYPWGNSFDATFCKMGKSRASAPKPEVIGAFPLDCSVYGVHDLGGGNREWCSTEDEEESVFAYGGVWSGSALTSRSAHRWNLTKGQVATSVGLRLALDSPDCDYHKGFGTSDSSSVERILQAPPSQPAIKAELLSVRQKLSNPEIWTSLVDGKEEWVLSHLAFVAKVSGSWSAIFSLEEKYPIAVAGSLPEGLSSNPFQGSSHSWISKDFRFFPCSSKEEKTPNSSTNLPLGYLVLPKDRKLSSEDEASLCSAITIVLHQRQSKKIEALQRENHDENVANVRKELSLVREAFAAALPNTYLRRMYPLLDGRSSAMQKIFRVLDKLIDSEVNVLVSGESGVGKERIARSIHQNGRSSSGSLIAVNCGAIPGNLIESELFGHVKGAFTGAVRENIGLFRKANGGTLFLDEIGDLPLEAQVKLLRVLQEKVVRPVGGVEEYPFTARVISATHRDLEALVESGDFREDLYWRLVVFEVKVPSLRERTEDIPILVEGILQDYQKSIQVSEEAMEMLQSYTWPGNVRELENELRRASVITEDVLLPEYLSKKIRSAFYDLKSNKVGGPLRQLLANVEYDAITFALGQTGGNKTKAAVLLGLSKRGLDLKMKRYNILPKKKGNA